GCPRAEAEVPISEEQSAGRRCGRSSVEGEAVKTKRDRHPAACKWPSHTKLCGSASTTHNESDLVRIAGMLADDAWRGLINADRPVLLNRVKGAKPKASFDSSSDPLSVHLLRLRLTVDKHPSDGAAQYIIEYIV
ncbi:MAG: hypothetical protein L6R42_008618, partial [Xanthoria sp. 1 TBL-2021]